MHTSTPTRLMRNREHYIFFFFPPTFHFFIVPLPMNHIKTEEMKQIAFKRIFINNWRYRDCKLPYMDSLAYTVQEYLYVNGRAVFGDCNFYMGDEIKLYDFMTLTYYFIHISKAEFGRTELKEYISELLNIRRIGYENIVEYINHRLHVLKASYEMIQSILWAAWIYAKVCNVINKEKTWKSVEERLYSLMTEYFEKEYDGIRYFKKKTPVAIADDAVKTMIKHIGEKQAGAKYSQIEKEETAEEKLTTLQAKLYAIKKVNEALKKEIKSLQKQKAEEVESEEEIGWHDKVRLDALLRLMEENGADLEKHGNKRKAAEIMRAISGLPLSTCTNYCTNRDLSTTHHEEEILKLNSKLQALGMKIRLEDSKNLSTTKY